MSCIEFKEILKAEEKDDKCFDNSPVAKEGGKRFAFNNTTNKTICRVKIDNCLITDQQKKCDFLFKVIESGKYYLIELKGVNIDEGVEQIVSTFDTVNRKIKAIPQDYAGIIVSSSVPSSAQQKFRKLQEKCYREKKLLIRKTHFQHTEKI